MQTHCVHCKACSYCGANTTVQSRSMQLKWKTLHSTFPEAEFAYGVSRVCVACVHACRRSKVCGKAVLAGDDGEFLIPASVLIRRPFFSQQLFNLLLI